MLGKCFGGGDIQSREHIITEKCFPDYGVIHASGGGYYPVDRKLTRKTLASKILCSKHNSKLSILDDEAIRFNKIFDRDVLKNKQLNQNARRVSNSYKFNSNLMARWVFKTMVNHVASKYIRYEWDQKFDISKTVPMQLLQYVYGEGRLKGHSGLYVLPEMVEEYNHADYFRFNVITSSSNGAEIVGCILHFRLVCFVLWLPERLHINTLELPEKYTSVSPFRLPGEITIRDKLGNSYRFEFF